MRKRNDDKRVLRAGNGQNQRSSRPKRNSRRSFGRRKNNAGYANPRRPMNPKYPKAPKPKRKANKKLVLVMIIALIAFVIGAGIGISFVFDESHVDTAPKFKNVTKEMTTHVNNNTTEDIVYDEQFDAVDFNENQTAQTGNDSSYVETQYAEEPYVEESYNG